MGLVLNKCFIFISSAQFHFSSYSLYHGIQVSEPFPRDVGGWECDIYHHSPEHTVQQVPMSRNDYLGTEISVAFLLQGLVNFYGAHLFKATIVYLQEANEDQTLDDQILWCLKAWISNLLSVDSSLIKGKLKSQFIKSLYLNSFGLYSVCCNLKSQTNKERNKQKQAQSIWLLFLPLGVLSGGQGPFCFAWSAGDFTHVEAALNQWQWSWCVRTQSSHPHGKIPWRPVLYIGAQSFLSWVMLELPSVVASLIKHPLLLYFLSYLTSDLPNSVSFTPK